MSGAKGRKQSRPKNRPQTQRVHARIRTSLPAIRKIPRNTEKAIIAVLLMMPFLAAAAALLGLRAAGPMGFDVAIVEPSPLPDVAARVLEQLDADAPAETLSQGREPLPVDEIGAPVVGTGKAPANAPDVAATSAIPAETAPDMAAPASLTAAAWQGTVKTAKLVSSLTASEPYCRPSSPQKPVQLASADASDPAMFGRRLAAAAKSQIGDFVVYNDAYQTISYPMGDVTFLYGVCTDVVIRAYRDLGIDLQKLVHEKGFGRDRNIDHRRTANLKRFFERFGETLKVTDAGADYQPGDIVTYYRPNNRGVRAHIAIVSDELGPSGAPMIIHNKGSGPELEDALFFDPITGHFRFTGLPLPLASRPSLAQDRSEAH